MTKSDSFICYCCLNIEQSFGFKFYLIMSVHPGWGNFYSVSLPEIFLSVLFPAEGLRIESVECSVHADQEISAPYGMYGTENGSNLVSK